MCAAGCDRSASSRDQAMHEPVPLHKGVWVDRPAIQQNDLLPIWLTRLLDITTMKVMTRQAGSGLGKGRQGRVLALAPDEPFSKSSPRITFRDLLKERSALSIA